MFRSRLSKARNLVPLREKMKEEELLDPSDNNPNPIDNTLTISNSENKYCLNYGPEFAEFLDARDKVMEHSFNFVLNFEGEK